MVNNILLLLSFQYTFLLSMGFVIYLEIDFECLCKVKSIFNFCGNYIAIKLRAANSTCEIFGRKF